VACSSINAFAPSMRHTGRSSLRMTAAAGDKVPAVDLDFGFPPEKVNMAERFASKKAIIVGLPGAFTPT